MYITEKVWKFKFFQKYLLLWNSLKLFSIETSSNKTRSDWAVKWLPSLVSIKCQQLSKMCAIVKGLSHPMHIVMFLNPPQ